VVFYYQLSRASAAMFLVPPVGAGTAPCMVRKMSPPWMRRPGEDVAAAASAQNRALSVETLVLDDVVAAVQRDVLVAIDPIPLNRDGVPLFC
jgi:hypothetical protein